MRRRWRSRVHAGLGRVPRSQAGAKLARLVESADRAFKNDSANSHTNGEHWLLEQLRPLRPRICFDVGANVGSWTEMALDVFDDVHVHAFEPVPETFDTLRDRLGDHPRVSINRAALTADGDPSLTMWSGGHNTRSTAVAPLGPDSVAVSVPATTGDSYCHDARIDHVDLLKVDAEGFDLKVLQGFSAMIESGSVDVIQFEFTTFAVYARTWLTDFYSLLEPHGYSIGKLHPTWIDWTPYDAENERFLRCNFVAVRAAEPARLLGLRAT